MRNSARSVIVFAINRSARSCSAGVTPGVPLRSMLVSRFGAAVVGGDVGAAVGGTVGGVVAATVVVGATVVVLGAAVVASAAGAVVADGARGAEVAEVAFGLELPHAASTTEPAIEQRMRRAVRLFTGARVRRGEADRRAGFAGRRVRAVAPAPPSVER